MSNRNVPGRPLLAHELTEARAHGLTVGARLGELMGKGLSYAERSKTAETRAALHCPPASRATQSAENPLPAKR